MTTRTVVTLVDDLDGSDAVETVQFGLNGVDFEVDLSNVNAAKLRDTLGEFIAAARKVATTATPPARKTTAKSPTEVSEARTWLTQHGYEVKPKGRIPQDLMDVWRQNKDQAQEETPAGSHPEELPAVDLDISDEAVLAWHQVKGIKIPDGRQVNGPMRERYLKAHGGA